LISHPALTGWADEWCTGGAQNAVRRKERKISANKGLNSEVPHPAVFTHFKQRRGSFLHQTINSISLATHSPIMNDNPDPASTDEAPLPIELIKEALRKSEFDFDTVEDCVAFHMQLSTCEVRIVIWAEPESVAKLKLTLPIRANVEHRAAVGELLHRLNYGAKRKFWEMDCNDGEIGLSSHVDTVRRPLDPDFFMSMFSALATTADLNLPYVTAVAFGQMKPDFAADQGLAALNTLTSDASTDSEE